MPKPYVKVSKVWNEDDVKNAIDRVESGKSIRSTAELYRMDEKTLRRKINDKKSGKTGMYCYHYNKVVTTSFPAADPNRKIAAGNEVKSCYS